LLRFCCGENRYFFEKGGQLRELKYQCSELTLKKKKKEFKACLDVTIFTGNTRINTFCGENMCKEDVVWKNLRT